jgi:hypothetical protein
MGTFCLRYTCKGRTTDAVGCRFGSCRATWETDLCVHLGYLLDRPIHKPLQITVDSTRLLRFFHISRTV